jgi:maltose-binding protein MalE
VVIDLVHYLTQPTIELDFAYQFNIIPSQQSAIRDPKLNKNELFRSALDQMMVGKPMPVFTEMRWIWDAMRPAYQGIFTDQISPVSAAAEMQKLAEKLISENR